jgi:hypothetical protein
MLAAVKRGRHRAKADIALPPYPELMVVFDGELGSAERRQADLARTLALLGA